MGAQNAELNAFLRHLSGECRVLLIGGVAVIAHGHSRSTKDADVWMEPLDSPEAWAEVLLQTCSAFPKTTLVALPGWHELEPDELPVVAEEVGMVRVLGLECPLDIFRRPNNFSEEEFEQVFSSASQSNDGTWLPHALDLILTKEDTGRSHDRMDITFLESKVRSEFGQRLASASLDEAKAILDRYMDHVVLTAALKNPQPEVQELALEHLRTLARDEDPFARNILRDRGEEI